MSLNQFNYTKSIILSNLNSNLAYLNSIDLNSIDTRLYYELKSRLNKIEPLIGEFYEIQKDIELLSEPPQIDEDERNKFETLYYSVISNLEGALHTFQSDTNSVSSKSSGQKVSNVQQSHTQNSSVQQLHIPNPTVQQSQEIIQSTKNNQSQPQLNFQPQSNLYNQIPMNEAPPQCGMQPPQMSQHNDYTQQSYIPQHSFTPQTKINLPTLDLPSFNGDPSRWVEFRDGFLSIIHSNQMISAMQKMYFLRSHLSGEAFELIKSIPVSTNNYTIAWQTLLDEYNHSSTIINSHVKAILNIQKLSKSSSRDLKQLLNDLNNNLRSLELLGEPTKCWDTLLIPILIEKFDTFTLREWNSFCSKKTERIVLEDLKLFLRNRCKYLEKSENSGPITGSREQNHKKSAVFASTNNKVTCHYCKKDHRIYNCKQFLNLSIPSRIDEMNKINACLNCLTTTHTNRNCNSKYRCKKCNKNHNTLLHLLNNKNAAVTSQTKEAASSENSDGDGTSATTCGAAIAEKNQPIGQVILATAQLYVQSSTGEIHKCRALLDSGSMSNFISERLHKKLNLNLKEVKFAVSGVGNSMTHIKYSTDINIISIDKKYKNSFTCLVMKKITDDLPMMSFNKNSIEIPKNIQLADPTYFKSSPIDLLLGSNIFWDLICVGKIQIENTNLSIQKTRLGWVLTGNLPNNRFHSKSISCLSTNSNSFLTNDVLLKFWEIEEINCEKPLSYDEQFCESHFLDTHERTPNGQFMVRIPFKNNLTDLGKSRDLTLKRYFSQERRLHKNPELFVQYSKFMQEYLNLGHMTEIEENYNDEELCYYLPHHPVIRESSFTTKTRIVFDASMKTNSGLSLNDTQYIGPTIQQDLLSILLRFRIFTFVISADISKMYRMVLVHPEERKFQRIFWRENINSDLKCFELNTVTYGTASAPYLAIRCLFQLSENHKKQFPLACEVIKTSFYVDDFLFGSNSKTELVQIQHEVSTLLASAGFQLRKWVCNNRELLSQFKLNDEIEMSVLSLGSDESNKTLGIAWNPSLDSIQYSRTISHEHEVSKRNILAEISKIFDPLGLLGPFVIKAKLLIQHLWESKISWDQEIPENLKILWSNFKRELTELNDLSIPRAVTIPNYNHIELHGFSDSSEKAYGAVIYIRTKTDSEIYSKLLISKSRVAPIKKVSLPRLELCGCLLLAQLVKKVTESLKISFHNIYLWSDSTIALCWLKASPARWKTFVANRVSQIQDLTDVSNWHHVSSSDNPADLLTRPSIALSDLKRSSLWWTGPSWLSGNNDLKFSHENILSNIPEQRIIANVSVSINNDFPIFKKYSSFSKLVRVIAYCHRFANALKNKSEKNLGSLTPAELEQSRYSIIRIVQQETFYREYQDFAKNKNISNKSSLLSLNPFFDKNNLIRVGGRLQHGPYSFDKKHPLILPAKHHITKLILSDEHKRLLHCGPTMLLGSIRERYWPISGRNVAKGVVRNCIVCFRASPHSQTYLMGNLPENRISQYVPFFNTGVDYAGPFLIKDRFTKFPKLIKSYICLFVCLATKAVHIEAVTQLDAKSFIATLKRFIGRRGKPKNIYSDNGGNFVGACNELKEIQDFLDKEFINVSNALTNDNISFHRIPARSPNFGGLWEAAIKRAKFHLKRVVGNAHLNFEEFSTVLIQIESILNSRPLCPLTSSPNDITPLTPAHFLIGKSLTAIPEPSYLELQENSLKRFQRLQQIIQHFWQRWKKEYVAELQTRTKWKKNFNELLKPGVLVLLKEENTPPLQWNMGRVTEVHPGSDGVVRVVSVKVGNSIVKRAASKLCILPNSNEN